MTYTVQIAKTQQTLNIDFATLPEASQKYIIQYGLKQCLNDSHSAFKDVEEAKGQVEAKLEALQNGTVTLRATSTARIVDPVEKEVNEMLITYVVNQAKVKRKDFVNKLKADNKTIREFIISKGGEALIDKYTKDVEKKYKSLAKMEVEIDVTDLGIIQALTLVKTLALPVGGAFVCPLIASDYHQHCG